jgi:creatinine amidohydrolase
MKLAQLTWPQLRDVPRETVVVVPLASLEQHSVHLPFSTDVRILDALTERLEAISDREVLLLPVQWLAYSARHLPFRGTVSVPLMTYVEMVVGTVVSMTQAGFGRVLLLNGQSDNEPHLAMALRLLRERQPGAAVIAVSYWSLLNHAESNVSEHASDLETSLLLHLCPESVVADEIARDEIGSASSHLRRVIHYTRIDQSSHHGGIGNPEGATAEKGRRFFEEMTCCLAELVRDFRSGILTG